MADAPFLVVGGGPAGVSAALTLAETGQHVMLVEQRDKLGGAIHRQPAWADAPSVPRSARHVRSWDALARRLEAARRFVDLRVSTVFLGVDGAGNVLLDDRREGRVASIRARGLIAAAGAVERVLPFPGWELPGVVTAGGAQVLLKETGYAPSGPVLVAGSGPLPIALAAQLAAAGNAPVAVLERGRPWRQPRALAKVSTHWAQFLEGLSYATRLASSRVPYLTDSEVVSAQSESDGLSVQVRQGKRSRVYHVRHLIIHDGLQPNDAGIPASDPNAIVPVVLAGDGREILGADAAILDGQRVAALMLERFNIRHRGSVDRKLLEGARHFQAALAELYRAPRAAPADETVVCRCEGLRLSDLKSLPNVSSAREIRLVGRFGMGACQGRFCSANVADLKIGGSSAHPTSPPRWPLRPVSVAALARLHDISSESSEP